MTINQLKQQGYRVKVSHRRQYYEFGPQNGTRKLTPYMTKRFAKHCGYSGEDVVINSGFSEMDVYLGGNTYPEASVSTKCSKYDRFDRKRALIILLGRIVKQLYKQNLV